MTTSFTGTINLDIRDSEPSCSGSPVAVDVSGEPAVDLEREFQALLDRD